MALDRRADTLPQRLGEVEQQVMREPRIVGKVARPGGPEYSTIFA